MPVDLTKLDRDAFRQAVASAESCAHLAGELLAAAEHSALETSRDVVLMAVRLAQAAQKVTETAQAIERAVEYIAPVSPAELAGLVGEPS